MPRHKPIECKTIDGTTISGWLYTVDSPTPAPAIIMSHGFNCVKEFTLPDIAETFHRAGYNVLLYDARSVGASGGTPQNLLDPLQMAEDLSDITTYMTSLPSVNPTQILLWGMSFGATITSTCAAIDRRPKALVLVCPLFSYIQPHKADKAYAQLIKDRISQLRGNEPYSLPPFSPTGDNPIGFGGAGGPGGVQAYRLMKAAAELGNPGFRDRIAFQTYQKLALYRPKEYVGMVRAPVLMVIPEEDEISPPEEQREVLARFGGVKREYWAVGKGHLNVATGEEAREMVEKTLEFFGEVVGGGL
ncbi:acetyltransferase fmaC [Aspergillus ibericus CBS 121593]|uniref:Alpha/beta-hydrolase n=1 Tax=Aspergillus ibericus CBS 121593 TaxID=1448316 RepID=A0A395HA60_9EURO|nr:alpha/beta-hydrolase [Aspergillus ibericus CBS 121593]RAL04560.1 alpha/beta-hydrolase [Aspergillus ibericus CBS 121593]